MYFLCDRKYQRTRHAGKALAFDKAASKRAKAKPA